MEGLSIGPILEFLERDDLDSLVGFLQCDRVDINEVDEDGWSALFHSVSKNNVNFVDCLLENGADPNICDNSNRTPLHEAVGEDNKTIAALLIEAGADVEAKAGK